MKKIIQICCVLLSVILLLTACDDNEISTTECEDFKLGIIDDNDNPVRDFVDDLCSDLSPNPAFGDSLGHQRNLNTLVKRIENTCKLTVSVICYACIETLPVQSEIAVTFTQNDSTYSKIIDILTPDDAALSFAGMHN